MKIRLHFSAAITLLSFLFLNSCSKNEDLVPVTNSLDNTEFSYSFDSEKANLGRHLFYDTKLSVNNSISCGSCHKQGSGFSDNLKVSTGFNGEKTTRNTPSIFNLNQSSHLFWDGRDLGLNSMVLRPILNHVEMGMGDLATLSTRVQNQPYYTDLFNRAYGSTEVTADRIAEALSAFIQNIGDQMTITPGVFTQEENTGTELFFVKYNCNGCHNIGMANGYQLGGNGGFVNIGLDNNNPDPGRGAVTQRRTDYGTFKIPNLTNIALTAPYMHDGRFNTLEEVIDHYSHGIKDNPNLDARLRDSQGAPVKMNIPEADKKALVAFLNRLTRNEFIRDRRFSDPFSTQH
jgi:cytochrome c peroxidase